MLWLLLGALYLLGAPVTMFFLAVVGVADSKDLDWADTKDLVLYVLLWPAIVMFCALVAAVCAGEKLRKWWENA